MTINNNLNYNVDGDINNANLNDLNNNNNNNTLANNPPIAGGQSTLNKDNYGIVDALLSLDPNNKLNPQNVIIGLANRTIVNPHIDQKEIKEAVTTYLNLTMNEIADKQEKGENLNIDWQKIADMVNVNQSRKKSPNQCRNQFIRLLKNNVPSRDAKDHNIHLYSVKERMIWTDEMNASLAELVESHKGNFDEIFNDPHSRLLFPKEVRDNKAFVIRAMRQHWNMIEQKKEIPNVGISPEHRELYNHLKTTFEGLELKKEFDKSSQEKGLLPLNKRSFQVLCYSEKLKEKADDVENLNHMDLTNKKVYAGLTPIQAKALLVLANHLNIPQEKTDVERLTIVLNSFNQTNLNKKELNYLGIDLGLVRKTKNLFGKFQNYSGVRISESYSSPKKIYIVDVDNDA